MTFMVIIGFVCATIAMIDLFKSPDDTLISSVFGVLSAVILLLGFVGILVGPKTIETRPLEVVPSKVVVSGGGLYSRRHYEVYFTNGNIIDDAAAIGVFQEGRPIVIEEIQETVRIPFLPDQLNDHEPATYYQVNGYRFEVYHTTDHSRQ